MKKITSLRKLERDLFRASLQQGLIEIQLGLFLLLFALAPPLSVYLGDFWSSFIFLPFWGAAYLGLRWLQNKQLIPRLGRAQYSQYRKTRLKWFTLLMLLLNIAALGLGVVSFFQFESIPSWIHGTRFSVILLAGFSLAAYLLDGPRFYLYGLAAAAAPVLGEWLYQNRGAAHHGFPRVFGVLSGLLILAGTVILVRILIRYPLENQQEGI